MCLIHDWRKVLRKAWSVRLIVIAGILTGVEVILPLISPDTLPRWWPLLIFASVSGAFVARMVAQKSMREPKDDHNE